MWAVILLSVVRQKYEVQVRDAYVLGGNTGVLRCEIPAFVKEYVAVTSWFQDSAFNIYPTAESGKYKLCILTAWPIYTKIPGEFTVCGVKYDKILTPEEKSKHNLTNNFHRWLNVSPESLKF